MTKKAAQAIKWSGCWERRKNDAICRWIICWTHKGDTTVGSIGGYSGGGAFQLEKFAILPNGRRVIEAHDDLSSHLSSDEMSSAEDCQDKSLDFHIEDEWVDAETLRLKPMMIAEFQERDDLLLGSNADVPDALHPLFLEIGLITRPLNR